MTIVLSLLIFLLILSFLVIIHEFGHFITAKWFGLEVNEFAIGFPPRIWSKQWRGTHYSIGAIPIGGFVSIKGESDVSEVTPGSFASLNRFKRSVILLAGVVMNFLLAVAIFSVIFAQGVEVPTDKVKVSQVAAGSPAQEVGLNSGDIILSAAGRSVNSSSDLKIAVQTSLDQPVELKFERSGETHTVVITPRSHPPAGQGAMGVTLDQATETRSYPWYEAPVKGVEFTLKFISLNLQLLGTAVANIFVGQTQLAEQVSGPVGIAYLTYQQVKTDPTTLLQLTAIISLSLAMMNVLPIPALDGGRLLFVLISALFRRNFYPKLERYIHTAGFVILMALIVVITYNDLVKIITTTSLGGKLNEILKSLP